MSNAQKRRLAILEAHRQQMDTKHVCCVVNAVGKPPDQVEREIAAIRTMVGPNQRIIVVDF